MLLGAWFASLVEEALPDMLLHGALELGFGWPIPLSLSYICPKLLKWRYNVI